MNIQAPDFILSVISEGYKLPLLHTPPRSFTKNNLSAINNSAFVLDLLASGGISEFSKDLFPLSLLVNVDSSWIYVLLTNLS